MFDERDSPRYLERLETIKGICAVLQEHDHPLLQAKFLQYELADAHMTVNDARGIVGIGPMPKQNDA